jgi:hypothetical protein
MPITARERKMAKTATLPSFEVSRLDASVIAQIADRALGLGVPGWAKLDFAMDITACHANGNPLRLQALLDADDFNFMHDVLGIRRHLDRDTGRLLNHFSPRFSRRDAA